MFSTHSKSVISITGFIYALTRFASERRSDANWDKLSRKRVISVTVYEIIKNKYKIPIF